MQPGTLLAERYRLESVIATGGMGVVYSATDLASGRPSAIKVLKPELISEPRFVERLRREARAASSLAHPNIVEVTDLVVEHDRAYLVMERLEGEPWGMAISDSPQGMLAQDVALIGRQLLSALDAAHHTGLIHRDVKPDNVFLVREPSGATLVKLLDFGLVKLESADRLTASHSVLGTWQYMAPEQARGERTDGRADLYSVGACLYYALTKKRPYQAADAEAATFALSVEPTPPLRALRPDVDPALAAVIERALVKDVLKRWQSAREMHDAFDPWMPKVAASPSRRIEPESDDEIQTNPVRMGLRPACTRPIDKKIPSQPRPQPPSPVLTGLPAPPSQVRTPKGDVTSEDLVEVAPSFESEIKTATNPLRQNLDPETETETETTKHEPAREPLASRASREPTLISEDSAPLPMLEPESVVVAGAPLLREPPQQPRSAPSRHRWRPPQKVRALPLMVPTAESVAVAYRRPSPLILVLFSVVLFASGLALGRLFLH